MRASFCHGSGIIMSIACGRERPAITSSSSTLSNAAVSLPPSRMIGRIVEVGAEHVGCEEGFAGLHPVDVAAERIDLAVVGDER